MSSIFEWFALALALSLDAFAVAAGAGCAVREIRPIHYVRLCSAFGFFQFAMPVIGWSLGAAVQGEIERWDHWIAFGLLAWIAWNLARSAVQGDNDAPPADPTAGRTLLVLALAASASMLVAGLSLALVGASVWGPSVLIGVICAVMTGSGLFLGQSIATARVLGRGAGFVGACALFGIGLKILFEHGVFG